MKLFGSMRIGVRLIVVFSVILAGLVAVSAFGINSVDTMGKADQQLYSQNLLGISGVADAIGSFYSLRIAILKAVYQDFSSDQAKTLSDTAAKAKQVTDQFIKDYQTAYSNSEKDANFTKIEELFPQYYADVETIVADINANDKIKADQDTVAAGTVGTAIVQQLDAIKTFNQDNGKSRADGNNKLTASTSLLVVSISIGVFALALLLAILVTNSITKPVCKLVNAAQQLSKGDTDIKLDIAGRDEVALLAQTFDGVISAIRRLTQDAGMLAQAGRDGRLSTRADASQHEGDYRRIVEGVNDTLDAVIGPLNVAAGQLELMACGEDLPVIDESRYNGDFRIIATNLNKARASLYLLLEDSGALATAAAEGKLSTRVDISRHKGGYAGIIKGINDTLDSVIQPVNEAAAVLQEMAKGNLGIAVVGNYKGDLALIKDNLNGTIVTLRGYIAEISSVLAQLAGGDLTVGITNDYRGEFVQIKDSINNIASSLSSVMGDINTAAEQVASGTQQVSSGSQALSQGATEQASAIEELTASVTDIAAQTKQNAMNAAKASELATAARDNAVDGNAKMKDLQQAMAGINEASANISKIIKVIDDIAFQTNLLALNAAVEAARAGQHGKGFAVVAEEVRSLAQRSANAAKETTDMIEGSVHKAQAGTRMADETADALNRIVTGVEKATELVSGIAKASGDQATAVSQVNRGIEQVSQVVQTNSATAEESAAASEELSSQAVLLKEMVGRFHVGGQNVLSSPRIAARTQQPVRALGTAHPFPAKPKISLGDREFGKY